MALENSILTSVKQTLGIAADYTPFDQDIIIHINSVLADLSQLGVGPTAGFMIEDDTTTWDDYLNPDPFVDLNGNLISYAMENPTLFNSVKSYMYLRVKVLFDGPDSRYVIAAITEQIKQWEWRISVLRETTRWIDPTLT